MSRQAKSEAGAPGLSSHAGTSCAALWETWASPPKPSVSRHSPAVPQGPWLHAEARVHVDLALPARLTSSVRQTQRPWGNGRRFHSPG